MVAFELPGVTAHSCAMEQGSGGRPRLFTLMRWGGSQCGQFSTSRRYQTGFTGSMPVGSRQGVVCVSVGKAFCQKLFAIALFKCEKSVNHPAVHFLSLS